MTKTLHTIITGICSLSL